MNLTKKDLFEQIKGMIGSKPDVGDSFQSRKNDKRTNMEPIRGLQKYS